MLKGTFKQIDHLSIFNVLSLMHLTKKLFLSSDFVDPSPETPYIFEIFDFFRRSSTKVF